MNTLRLLTPVGLLGMLALSACDATFDPGTQVDSLRVLAVRADSPFVHPGDTVHLSALSYELGFSSHSHFSAAFKQAYGRSPTEFRQSVILREGH